MQIGSGQGQCHASLQKKGSEYPPWRAQVADRMEVLQMALDARPAAYCNAAAVEELAALLGLAGRGAEVQTQLLSR